jgi:hypothetical protein
MEAFMLSVSEYARLDHFLSTTLAITHGSPLHPPNPNNIRHGPKHQPSSLDIWNIWEAGLFPPSIIVQKAKFKLYYNTITSPHKTILKHMLKVLPHNSFITELEILQKEWGSPDLLSFIHTKPSKASFKRTLNMAKDQAHSNLLYRHLPSQWKFAPITKCILPEHIRNPNNMTMMRYRAHHLFFPSTSNCLVCNLNTPDTTLHKLMKCPNILRAKSRDSFWSALSEAHPAGYIFIQTLPLLQLFYIILGLIEVNDDKVQEVIAKSGEHILSII